MIFFFLGQTPDTNWHHRIIRAKTENDVLAWWKDIWSEQPYFCMELSDFSRAVSLADELSRLGQKTGQSGSQTIFGVYEVRENNTSSPLLGFTPLWIDSSDKNPNSLEDAVHHYEKENENTRVLHTVTMDPLLHALSLMRAVSEGEINPDEDL